MEQNMFDMTNKVVIITGASGNLGPCIAEKVKTAGGKRALIARSESKLKTLYGEHFEKDDQLILPNVDLTDADQVDKAFKNVMNHFGRIDALVHAVGMFKGGNPLHEESLESWDKVFNINFRSAVLSCRAVLPFFLEQDSGGIVTVSSQQGLKGSGKFSAYSTAKGALIRLTESIAAEVKDSNIRINTVVPAIIDTPENRESMPNADFSKWTSPEAIADTILFLLSDQSRAIAGATVPVSG